MFFPIPLEFKNTNVPSRFPLANAAIVALCVLFYLFGWNWPTGPGTGGASVLLYGFSHFGFWHLALNMWVLWVFGNPVNRRLGNALYLLVYLGSLLIVGLFARLILPIGLVGSSGAIFAVIAISLVLMPAAIIDVAYVATFPLSLLLAVFRRPKYELNWILAWGIVTTRAWWCLLLVPLMELASVIWRGYWLGWSGCWTPAAHLLGLICGVVVVLMLPAKITKGTSLNYA